ncbi:Cof-type HAD-IIB family hydrolase [Streptococcus sp. H49]|uniref:Cof-type HAD-IIB family hydrolase n=1 Tax=Streptococcus huangxiaojuni TaxID=3237239 RepID=UPI0034A3273A
MAVKLIASDMDGTFLDSRGDYDRRRFERLLDILEEKDIKFVVASGNSMPRLAMMFDGLLERLIVVAENGAQLITNGQLFAEHTVAKSDLENFLVYFSKQLAEYKVILSGLKATYMLKDSHFSIDSSLIKADQAALLMKSIVELSDFNQLPADERFFKISLLLPEEKDRELIADFNNRFPGHLTATASGFGGVDIIQTGWHKGRALAQLMQHYGLTADQVMAFGDGGNDIEMLRLAGASYAMDNAPQEVKAAARFIAPNHKEAGVFQVIEDYLKKSEIK